MKVKREKQRSERRIAPPQGGMLIHCGLPPSPFEHLSGFLGCPLSFICTPVFPRTKNNDLTDLTRLLDQNSSVLTIWLSHLQLWQGVANILFCKQSKNIFSTTISRTTLCLVPYTDQVLPLILWWPSSTRTC